MPKMFRVYLTADSREEAETEAQAVRQFLSNLDPDDCDVECETDDDDGEEEAVEEADEK